MSVQEKFIGESLMKDTPSKKIGLRIKDGIVSTEKINDGAVTSIKIANGAVGQMQLDSESQTTSVIQQGNTNPVSSDATYAALQNMQTTIDEEFTGVAFLGEIVDAINE